MLYFYSIWCSEGRGGDWLFLLGIEEPTVLPWSDEGWWWQLYWNLCSLKIPFYLIFPPFLQSWAHFREWLIVWSINDFFFLKNCWKSESVKEKKKLFSLISRNNLASLPSPKTFWRLNENGKSFSLQIESCTFSMDSSHYKDHFQWIIFRENWPEDVPEIAVSLWFRAV